MKFGTKAEYTQYTKYSSFSQKLQKKSRRDEDLWVRITDQLNNSNANL